MLIEQESRVVDMESNLFSQVENPFLSGYLLCLQVMGKADAAACTSEQNESLTILHRSNARLLVTGHSLLPAIQGILKVIIKLPSKEPSQWCPERRNRSV